VTRFAKNPAPSDSADKPPRFYYAARGQTLFVLDDARLIARNLPEGTAQHLCFQTEALLEKGCGKTILPPYWDEVEKP